MNEYEKDTINNLEKLVKLFDPDFIVPENKISEYKQYLIEELKKYNINYYEITITYEE